MIISEFSFKFFFTLFVLTLIITSNSLASENKLHWEPIPITTVGDASVGRAGGEGFQVVEDIVFARSDPRIMYLSTNTSQVWKSLNSGRTWRSVRKGFKSHGATSLAVDRSNPNIVFAAGTMGRNENFSFKLPNRYEGIYRTLDGGSNWKLVRSTNFNTLSNKGSLILVMPKVRDEKKTIVYAASHSEGLLRSDDFGETWNIIEANLHSISDIALDYGSPAAIFIAAKEGLFRFDSVSLKKIGKNIPGRSLSITSSLEKPKQIFVSTDYYGVYMSLDGGATFNYRNARNTVVLESSPIDSNFLFAKRNQHNQRMPLYSHDSGKTWSYSKLSNNMDPIFDKSNEQFWFSSPFVAHPTKKNIVFTVSNGKGRILKSMDAGKTWQYSGSGFTGGRMQDIAFLPGGGYLFAFTDHGLWESVDKNLDAFKYLPIPRVFGARSVSAIAVDNNLIVAAIGLWGKKALAVSRDYGKSWHINKNTFAKHNFIAIDPFDNKYIYAGNYITNDHGMTWSKSDYSIEAIDAKGHLYALKKKGGTTEVVRSSDRGRNWKILMTNIPVSIKNIYDVAIADDTTTVIYLATNKGVFVINKDGFKLKNDMNGLDKDDYGLLVVSGIVVDTNDRGVIYAARRSPGYGQSNGVFKSINGGKTWENINLNLGQYLTVWSIKISPVSNYVFIGTSSGTYRLITS